MAVRPERAIERPRPVAADGSTETELFEAYGDRWSPAKKSDHFARLKTAVGVMSELLDAVLVIGKSDAGRLDCKPAPTDVERFVRDSVDGVAAVLTDKHSLEVDVERDLPSAHIDEKLASHILVNLLSNAAKSSPDGGPVVLSVRRDAGDLVVVSDRGIGITDQDKPELFESFHRGRNLGVIPGAGLGLAVVKRGVSAHGGSVEVESTVGEGTTFTVRLPAFEGERAQEGADRDRPRHEPEASAH